LDFTYFITLQYRYINIVIVRVRSKLLFSGCSLLLLWYCTFSQTAISTTWSAIVWLVFYWNCHFQHLILLFTTFVLSLLIK